MHNVHAKKMTAQEEKQGFVVCPCGKYAYIFRAAVIALLPDDYSGERCLECGLLMYDIEKLRIGWPKGKTDTNKPQEQIMAKLWAAPNWVVNNCRECPESRLSGGLTSFSCRRLGREIHEARSTIDPECPLADAPDQGNKSDGGADLAGRAGNGS